MCCTCTRDHTRAWRPRRRGGPGRVAGRWWARAEPPRSGLRVGRASGQPGHACECGFPFTRKSLTKRRRRNRKKASELTVTSLLRFSPALRPHIRISCMRISASFKTAPPQQCHTATGARCVLCPEGRAGDARSSCCTHTRARPQRTRSARSREVSERASALVTDDAYARTHRPTTGRARPGDT